jgi:hypothetical protein
MSLVDAFAALAELVPPLLELIAHGAFAVSANAPSSKATSDDGWKCPDTLEFARFASCPPSTAEQIPLAHEPEGAKSETGQRAVVSE